MAKKKQKRRSKRRQKSNLLPLLAIGVGVYLLTRHKKVVSTLPLDPGSLPALPSGSAPAVQRLFPRRIPTYV